MRRYLMALMLGCALTAPAVAVDWNDDIYQYARRWPSAAPQSEWQHDDALPPDDHVSEAELGFDRLGAGWSRLDGWMRGDPLLRQWVMHRFDLDGDTWLSGPEAESARRTFYAMADANGSGRITSEEFVSGWVKVRHELRDFYVLDAG